MATLDPTELAKLYFPLSPSKNGTIIANTVWPEGATSLVLVLSFIVIQVKLDKPLFSSRVRAGYITVIDSRFCVCM